MLLSAGCCPSRPDLDTAPSNPPATHGCADWLALAPMRRCFSCCGTVYKSFGRRKSFAGVLLTPVAFNLPSSRHASAWSVPADEHVQ